MPPGVSLLHGTNVIQGTPTEPGNYAIQIRAIALLPGGDFSPEGWSEPVLFNIAINGSGPNQIPPSITLQPVGRTINVGESALLSVGVSGPGPISYQWRKNGALLPGEMFSSLFITNASAAHVGSYTVKVWNGTGDVTSNAALMTVLGAGGSALAGSPVIVRHPQNESVAPGANAVFSVDVTNSTDVTYQWRRDGAPLSGQTGSSLAVLNVSANDVATYDVVVTNPSGSVTSDTANLVINLDAQTIRFLPLPNRAFPVFDATTTLTLKAVATSLLPVTFSVVSGPANVTGNILTLTGPGTVVVRASQAGQTSSYGPATQDREFTVFLGAPPDEPSAPLSVIGDGKRGGIRLRAVNSPAPESVWFDIDRDGYLEEITPVGVGGFDVVASVNVDYTQMVLDAAGMAATLQAMWTSGVWSPFWSNNFTADSPRVDDNKGWVRVANISTLSLTNDYDIFFNLAYRFTPEPNEEYVLFGEYAHRWGDRVENWPVDSLRVRRIYRTQDLEVGQTVLSVQEGHPQAIEMLSVPYYLIRKGRAGASSVEIPKLYRMPASALSLSFNLKSAVEGSVF